MVSDMQSLLKTFFQHLWIPLESLEVEAQSDINFCIQIQTPDSALLIGRYGKNIDDLELIIRSFFSQKFQQKIRVRLEINDYKKTRNERLIDFIAWKIDELKQQKIQIPLPYYDSYQRKKIHDYIHRLKDDQIQSKSTWEGKERRMTLSLKKSYSPYILSIDIDGVDI